MAEIDRYLKFMVETGASDFHLGVGLRPTFRVNGTVRAASSDSTAPFTAEAVEQAVGEILPETSRDEFQASHDADFAYEIPDVGRFRVNVFRDLRGTGAVFRHIPHRIPTFEDLGLPDVIRTFCSLNKGLVLITGPTGSGKSSTLAAMVDLINETRRDHILTIEDPIEFVHENKKCLVNQREIKSHTKSFSRALRAALREDPDIVLVGEMRDLETTATALEVAETGHLVLGTLHTSTAASTVDRVVDQFPPDEQAQIRTMLSVSLKGVVSQTLLARADSKGRVAAFEILVMTAGVANQIREGKSYQIPSAIQTGGRLGMRLLNADLLRLVREGSIRPEEAYGKCIDKEDLATSLRSAGYALDIG